MVAGRHEGEGPPDGAGFDGTVFDAEPAQEQTRENDSKSENGPKRARRHRRVSTELVRGSDPNPQPEPPRHAGNENDDRLKAEKPPHWG